MTTTTYRIPAEGDTCRSCRRGTLKAFRHRQPDGARGDQRHCFNGLPRGEHLCVGTCHKPGLLCSNCRLLTDMSGLG
ncbi:hypothetical protein [Streptomyces albidoflavus]|uniref:hypothetical protein n=1 Tax=Streptomyces albidoflavus TaxID=1886 RepID=UPI0033DD74A3